MNPLADCLSPDAGGATATAPETRPFQAEVRQLLDIVIHSLYTDREVFIRELVSNAADALEKFRHLALVGEAQEDGAPLEITLELDEAAKTFVIADNGVGLTREELDSSLGTIAHSGTKAFLSRLKEAQQGGTASLIGQFGVGFYSVFMVAKRVTVETRSYRADARGWRWTSDGGGTYTVESADIAHRGTRITVELKDDAAEFATDASVKKAIRRYSSFVPFPVRLRGEQLNAMQAIWKRNPREVTEAERNEFYRYLANTSEDPLLALHFTVESPMDIASILFVPQKDFERMGLGKTKPGVDLYCRKVLISKHPEDLLPEWLRFLRGVVDSEDLPLNVSRESMQDSRKLKGIAKTLTTRFLKFLGEVAAENPAKYDGFYEEFGHFLKEGVVQDYGSKPELQKLLRFESSLTDPGKRTSLPEYKARMKEGQKDIFYLSGPSRAAIESGPYLESFRQKGIEVLYTKEGVDDYTLTMMMEFEGHRFVSVDSADAQAPEAEVSAERLSRDDADVLCGWAKGVLGSDVGSVRVSTRLVESPAVVVTEGGMSSAMQRVMASLGRGQEKMADRLVLELNPGHALVRRLWALKGSDEAFAKEVLRQLYDNALLSAGLLDNPQAMVSRLNALLGKAAGAQ
jgi:molecular chaperone HtpG